MIRKILTVLVLGGSIAVAACNTVDGAGKDLESAGSAVSDAAK